MRDPFSRSGRTEGLFRLASPALRAEKLALVRVPQ